MINSVRLFLITPVFTLVGFATVETPFAKFHDVAVHRIDNKIVLKFPVKRKFSKNFFYYEITAPELLAKMQEQIENEYNKLIAEDTISRLTEGGEEQ